ncbi:MAG: acyl-CoA synthetase (AMP-forming)/AMP-acid ligase II [Halieaceae bacterium]|jgi:acyl-CoA synthetase (AMP-forming)/AMP-acid ligase II
MSTFEHLYADALKRCSNRPFLVAPSKTWTYGDFFRRVDRMAASLAQLPENNLASYMADSPALVALMFASASSGKSLLVMDRNFDASKVEALTDSLNIDTLFTDDAESLQTNCELRSIVDLWESDAVADHEQGVWPDGFEAELRILTSGTTGSPKCARYRWSDLVAQLGQPSEQPGQRWLFAYHLNHFAGVQMLLHVLAVKGTLVLTESNRVADALRALLDFNVTHISSTPTFWRFALALLKNGHTTPQLRHITLGSEAVTADLLTQLKYNFPAARIIHIYASTEAGSCVSVDDMNPGLPVSILSRPSDAAVQFKIEEGELQVRTLHGMVSYLESEPVIGTVGQRDWRRTGDLVAIEGDRIQFRGRRSEVINVGGVKVYPLEVESLLNEIADIKLIRVYGQANPVVGEIVAVDVVLHEGADSESVENSIREISQQLPRHSRPRSINFVAILDTVNNKLSRR